MVSRPATSETPPRRWTRDEDDCLIQLRHDDLAWALVGVEMDRTVESCRARYTVIKAQRLERLEVAKERFEAMNNEIEWNAILVARQRHTDDKLGDAPGPTPQTAKRLRADVLRKLYDQQRLSNAEFKAAEEIRDVLHEIGKGLSPYKAEEDLGTRVTGGGGAYRDPIEKMSAKAYRQWKSHYVPWSQAIGKETVGDGVTRLQLVLDLVIENIGPSQLRSKYGLRKRRDFVTKCVKEDLHRYAELAGFVTRFKPRAA